MVKCAGCCMVVYSNIYSKKSSISFNHTRRRNKAPARALALHERELQPRGTRDDRVDARGRGLPGAGARLSVCGAQGAEEKGLRRGRLNVELRRFGWVAAAFCLEEVERYETADERY